MPPAERYVAPLLVLAFHSLLLVDIAGHRHELLSVDEPLVAAKWLVVGAAVFAYLRTVISDPGFLRSSGTKSGRLACCIVALASYALSGVGLLLRGRAAKPAAATPHTSGALGGEAVALRDMRDTREVSARELQPIGRSSFDVLGPLEVDSDDPGEESISLADLETGTLPSGAAHTSSPAASVEDGANDSAATVFGRKRRDPAAPAGASAENPHERKVVMQSGQRLRFCRICNMHQPLRTKHCRECEQCVRTHDHHCPWIGTCVGEGNRMYFYWFLAAQFLELTVFLFEGVRELFQEGIDIITWFSTVPLLVIGLVLMALLQAMVGCLLCFHTYLAVSNITTWESLSWRNISYLRSLSTSEGSPFSASLRSNLAAYCCPAWCPQRCTGASGLKRTEDGWVIWELGEPHLPLKITGARCGCPGSSCNLCGCFDTG